MSKEELFDKFEMCVDMAIDEFKRYEEATDYDLKIWHLEASTKWDKKALRYWKKYKEETNAD